MCIIVQLENREFTTQAVNQNGLQANSCILVIGIGSWDSGQVSKNWYVCL